MDSDKKTKVQENWIMKVNIPLDDVFFFQDWKGSCQAKAPVGFDDYYWGKIKHDHYFTKSFEPLMTDVATELSLLREEIKTLKATIDTFIANPKEEKDSDLMK